MKGDIFHCPIGSCDKMKKILKFIFIGLFIFFQIQSVKALTVSENDLLIATGNNKSVKLSVNTDKSLTSVEFTMVYSTYDIPANFLVNSNYTDSYPNSVKHKVNFPEPATGNIELGTISIRVVNNPTDMKGTINIHSAKCTTTNGETINLDSQNINITIGEEQTPTVNDQPDNSPDTNKNLLKEIKSNIVNISLKENVFEYKITIDKDLEELDLNPIALDDSYQIDISTQKIKELKDNQIIITVKDNNNLESTYTIKVNTKKENKETKENNSQTNNSYQGKWITLIIVFIIILVLGFLSTQRKK